MAASSAKGPVTAAIEAARGIPPSASQLKRGIWAGNNTSFERKHQELYKFEDSAYSCADLMIDGNGTNYFGYESGTYRLDGRVLALTRTSNSIAGADGHYAVSEESETLTYSAQLSCGTLMLNYWSCSAGNQEEAVKLYNLYKLVTQEAVQKVQNPPNRQPTL